jgi:signal transduction histidine kinase
VKTATAEILRVMSTSLAEAGRMELELAEFSLPVAIDNALILVRERASRRGIRLGRAIDEPTNGR